MGRTSGKRYCDGSGISNNLNHYLSYGYFIWWNYEIIVQHFLNDYGEYR